MSCRLERNYCRFERNRRVEGVAIKPERIRNSRVGVTIAFGLVYRFVLAENSPREGGGRGLRNRSPAATGPAGDRRICLRFIPNHNWWLSLALLGASSSGARREEPTDFRVDEATPSLLWFCIMGRARSRAFGDNLWWHRSARSPKCDNRMCYRYGDSKNSSV